MASEERMTILKYLLAFPMFPELQRFLQRAHVNPPVEDEFHESIKKTIALQSSSVIYT